MSNTEIEDEEAAIVQQAEESKPAEVEAPIASERLLKHIDRQSEVIQKQAEILAQMEEKLKALESGSYKENRDSEEDQEEESTYITKKQHNAAINEVLERANRQSKMDQLRKEIEVPEVQNIINRAMESDPAFKMGLNLLIKSDPIAGMEMALQKARQIMSRKASVPKPITQSAPQASLGSENRDSIPPSGTLNKIGGFEGSTLAQREALARTIQQKMLNY